MRLFADWWREGWASFSLDLPCRYYRAERCLLFFRRRPPSSAVYSAASVLLHWCCSLLSLLWSYVACCCLLLPSVAECCCLMLPAADGCCLLLPAARRSPLGPRQPLKTNREVHAVTAEQNGSDELERGSKELCSLRAAVVCSYASGTISGQGRRIKGFESARAPPEYISAPSRHQKHPLEI